MTGQVSYYSGRAAEAQVADHFRRAGLTLQESRWRGPGGEIDLIFADNAGLVFVEVKRARDHDTALARVTARQLARIRASAEDYAGRFGSGTETCMRIDIALVDDAGRIAIIENVSMH